MAAEPEGLRGRCSIRALSRGTRWSWWGLGIAAFALGACTSAFDRNDQIVNGVRILAVRAHVESSDGIDWADADVGDTVQLSALVTNPGNDPSLSVTWVTCIPITGQLSPCTEVSELRDPTQLIGLANDPATGVILLGTGNTVEYTIPEEVTPHLQDLITRAQNAANAECALYFPLPVIVMAGVSGQKPFTAFKSVRLSPWSKIGPFASDPRLAFYPRNANPVAGGMTIPSTLALCSGSDLTTGCVNDSDCATLGAGGTCERHFCTGPASFPPGTQTICVPVGQQQSFYDCGLNGPVLSSPGEGPPDPEQPAVTWYMTAGTLSGFAAPPASDGDLVSRTFTRFSRPAGPFTVYAVVRDGRDGEDWVAQEFE
jgi:hypothetical protein